VQGLAGAGIILGIFDPVMPFILELARGFWREYANPRTQEVHKQPGPFE
jgi:hypothetical protein